MVGARYREHPLCVLRQGKWWLVQGIGSIHYVFWGKGSDGQCKVWGAFIMCSEAREVMVGARYREHPLCVLRQGKWWSVQGVGSIHYVFWGKGSDGQCKVWGAFIMCSEAREVMVGARCREHSLWILRQGKWWSVQGVGSIHFEFWGKGSDGQCKV